MKTNFFTQIASLGLAGVLAFGSMSTISGCSDKEQNKTQEYSLNGTNPRISNKTKNLEGEIISVQPSSIPMQSGNWGANHSFEYVLVKTKENQMYCLVYPTSAGIFTGKARISFREVLESKLTQRDLLSYAAKDGHYCRYAKNTTINTDGIITPDGIQYVRELPSELGGAR